MIGTIALILLCQVMSIAAQLSLKLGMRDPGEFRTSRFAPLRIVLRPWLWFGCGLYLVGMILWFKVLSQADLSFAYPFGALAFVGVVLSSQLFLHERVSARRWAGVFVILLGLAFVISSGSSSTH
jgi:drug/metabolite transporter (DMT)-like permease